VYGGTEPPTARVVGNVIRRLVIVAFAGALLSVAWATEPARDGVRAAERDGG